MLVHSLSQLDGMISTGSPHVKRHPSEVCTILGPLGYEGAQHRQTLRPSVDGTRSKALRPFGLQ